MPPRKLLPTKPTQIKTEVDSARGIPSKVISSRNKSKDKLSNSNHSEDISSEHKEPEIDIQAAIEEMINESNSKIITIIQQRQENLVNLITQIDIVGNSPPKNIKK